MTTRARVGAMFVALLAGAPNMHAVGGSIADNAGNVAVTWSSIAWSSGFPSMDFSLPTPPDGVRRDLVRYSGWWVRPAGATAEARLGNPAQEVYDTAGGRADFLWNCPASSTCALAESGRVVDAQGPTGAGTFVSELLVRNTSTVVGVIDVFHLLDPVTHGAPTGQESATFWRANWIDFAAITPQGIVRRVRYRASGLPVSNCAADNYPDSASLLARLNDTAVTNFVQPTVSGLSSTLGLSCAMQWHLALEPGEARLLRVSVSVGVDDPLIKGDFDLDNQPDVWFEDAATLTTRLWPMRRSSRWGSPVDLPATPGFRVVGVADFNNDSLSDMLLRRVASPYELRVRFGNGVDFGAEQVMSVPIRAPEWELAATGDFSRDGHGDLLWRHTQTQQLEISLLTGTAQIGLATPNPSQAAHANWKVVLAADWDRDHDLDLLWYNTTSGKIVFWWLDENYQRVLGAFAEPPNAGDANWSVVAVSDFGPGPAATLPTAYATPDILWRNATSSRLVVWHMNASGQRTSGVFTTPDAEAPNWRVVGPR